MADYFCYLDASPLILTGTRQPHVDEDPWEMIASCERFRHEWSIRLPDSSDATKHHRRGLTLRLQLRAVRHARKEGFLGVYCPLDGTALTKEDSYTIPLDPYKHWWSKARCDRGHPWTISEPDPMAYESGRLFRVGLWEPVQP